MTATSPSVTVAQNPDGTVALNFGGGLSSPNAVTGPHSTVSGVTSPFTVDPNTAGSPATFYRAGP